MSSLRACKTKGNATWRAGQTHRPDHPSVQQSSANKTPCVWDYGPLTVGRPRSERPLIRSLTIAPRRAKTLDDITRGHLKLVE